MNSTYSLDQIQKTGDFNADILMRQNKLDKMAKLLEVKSNNPGLNNLKSPICWNYHFLRYNNIEEKKLCFHLIGYHHHQKLKKKTSNTNLDDVKVTSKVLKMTSNDLKTTSKEPVKIEKSRLKGGANIQINEKLLDEVLDDGVI